MNQKKKKKALRILGAHIFSEFFGEKTKRFQTAVTEKTTNFTKRFFWPLVQTWSLMRLLSSGVFSICRPFNNLQERGTTEVINKSTISNLYSLNHSKANQLANFIIIRVRSSLARSRPLMLCIVLLSFPHRWCRYEKFSKINKHNLNMQIAVSPIQ